MANQKENEKLNSLEKRVGRMEVRIDEVLIPKLDKVVDFVEENKSGITTASLLNSKIISLVLGGILAAAVFFISKGGM